MKITYKVAVSVAVFESGSLLPDESIAAGRDAANRQMRAEGRNEWNEQDFNLATEVANRFMAEGSFTLRRFTVKHPK